MLGWKYHHGSEWYPIRCEILPLLRQSHTVKDLRVGRHKKKSSHSISQCKEHERARAPSPTDNLLLVVVVISRRFSSSGLLWLWLTDVFYFLSRLCRAARDFPSPRQTLQYVDFQLGSADKRPTYVFRLTLQNSRQAWAKARVELSGICKRKNANFPSEFPPVSHTLACSHSHWHESSNEKRFTTHNSVFFSISHLPWARLSKYSSENVHA